MYMWTKPRRFYQRVTCFVCSIVCLRGEAAIQQITVGDIVWLGASGRGLHLWTLLRGDLSGAISAWTVVDRSKQSPPAKMIDGQYD